MDLKILFPIIIRLITALPKIQAAIRTGGVLKIVEALLPEISGLIKDIGAEVAPDAPPEAQKEIGALHTFDTDRVKRIQEFLNRLQTAGLDVDGTYGNATKNAVRTFQQANGLEVDGWAGKLTVAKMEELSR